LKYEEYLRNKGFFIDTYRNIAISSPFLQEKIKLPLIHENKFFEGFQYKIRVFESRITLQIEPKLSVLVPVSGTPEGWVFPLCFQSSCEKYSSCNILPTNDVLIKNNLWSSIPDCSEEPINTSLVYDRWSDEEKLIPTSTLLKRDRERIHFSRARTYSLKTPEARKSWTSRFFNYFTQEECVKIHFTTGTIIFTSPFTIFSYDPIKTLEYRQYSVIPEIEAVFGEGLLEINPYRGINRFGSFSFNKQGDVRYPHPELRVFAVCPDTLQSGVSLFLDKLKNGLYRYKGFSEDDFPYRTSLEYRIFSLPYNNEIDFIERVKARILNLMQEYPPRLGDVLFLPIPSRSNRLYDSLKGFTLSRKIRSQMIQSHNLNMQEFPLFNFSLSLYTKAGGVPWVLDPSNFDVADCYIGYAFSMKNTEMISQGKFFVGVADVFNAYGEHLMFALHQGSVNRLVKGLHVDRDFMYDLTSKAIDRYNDKLREPPQSILFHKLNHFSGDEIIGVIDALEEKGVETSYLVHVQNNNLFRAYDETLENQVRRGTYFRIGPGNAIIFPTGYLESLGSYQKMGTPKSVQLNVKSVNSDRQVSNQISDDILHNICRNYLAFTRLRWNTLGTRLRDPLTIYAATKVAQWLRMGIEGLEGVDIRDVL